MEILTDLYFLGRTFDLIGKIMVIILALLVHKKVRREGKIDKKVIREIVIEQSLVYVGILFIIAGYVLEVIGSY